MRGAPEQIHPVPALGSSMRPELHARVERALWTGSSHIMIFGWLADEGRTDLTFALVGEHATLSAVPLALLRHARPDVADVHGGAPHDFGFMIVAKVVASRAGAPAALQLRSHEQARNLDLELTCASDQRLLEELLAFLGEFQAHNGREVVLSSFLAGGGRQLIADLNSGGHRRAAHIQQVERFGPQNQGPTFMTVLFGSIDAACFQPILFAKAGVKFGEWIYICNSPELAAELIRSVHTSTKLYDLPIRVVVMSGNAGFGGANNAAMQIAASGHVVLMNPDVYPLQIWADLFNTALQPDRFTTQLRGGLLFYDEEMLMHGGMYLAEDVFYAQGGGEGDPAEPCRLFRIEHFDKGAPFHAQDWVQAREVDAVTGAVMAFQRSVFESLGGFSGDFVYGHYEDADLCLRWADRVGPIAVDPLIRLVHLEGMGSKTRLPHFHGAAIVNRHIFDARNRHIVGAA